MVGRNPQLTSSPQTTSKRFQKAYISEQGLAIVRVTTGPDQHSAAPTAALWDMPRSMSTRSLKKDTAKKSDIEEQPIEDDENSIQQTLAHTESSPDTAQQAATKHEVR